MKKCPYCAEEIQDEAIKCRHCSEFLDGTGRPPPRTDNVPWYFWKSTIVMGLFCVGPLALPLIWWHPKMTPACKIGLTIGILVFSLLLTLATVQGIRNLQELYRMMEL